MNRHNIIVSDLSINSFLVNNYIFSSDYYHNLVSLMNQFDIDKIEMDLIDDNYLFDKLVGLCTKNGNRHMAYLNVFRAFELIKQFFRIRASVFLKKAVLLVQTFAYLHKIPRGRKIRIYPRILPARTRIYNALYIIAKEAFSHSKEYKHFYISLARSIIENSIRNEVDNIYRIETRQTTETAKLNKRNIKYFKKGKHNINTKIKRKERFRLFKKINIKK